jgi:hypothetical protein
MIVQVTRFRRKRTPDDGSAARQEARYHYAPANSRLLEKLPKSTAAAAFLRGVASTVVQCHVLGSFKSELKIYAVYEEQKYKSYSLGPDFYGAARPASQAKNKSFGSAAAG